ncbi:hypothetical protein V2J09_010913 [Rumex salicifolius]
MAASILAHLPPSKPFSVATSQPFCSLPAEILLDVRLTNSSSRRRRMRLFSVRSSADDSTPPSGAAVATEEEEGMESDNPPAETPKGLPTLISPLNVEKALRGIAITDVDHYGRLGISRGCPYDQVLIAYKNKVEELKKQELEEEEELSNQLEQLKESYTILSTVEERRMYDWSLGRSDQPDRYLWPFETDITQRIAGTPPPREEEDVGPTKAVGYFFLGWLILGFTLSIALNR